MQASKQASKQTNKHKQRKQKTNCINDINNFV
jgi:hypothetical protein